MKHYFLMAAGAAAWGVLLLGVQPRAAAQNANEHGAEAGERATDSPHPTAADTTHSGEQYREQAPNEQGTRERANNEWNDRNESPRERRDRDWQRDNWQSQIRFGEPTREGLTISRVEQGSHYYRSGLRDGDVIVSYNGRPLRSQDEFGRWANDRSGERVPVIVLRDGRRETVYIQYENDRNQSRGYANNAGSYGSQAFLGVRFETRPRAVVSAVVPGSPAEEAGLKPGDELISINGRRINTAREATRIVASMQPGERIDIEFSRPTREHAQAVLKEHPGEIAGAEYRRSNGTRQGATQYDGVEQSSYDEQISTDPDQSSYSGSGTIERGSSERRGNRGIFQRLRN